MPRSVDAFLECVWGTGTTARILEPSQRPIWQHVRMATEVVSLTFASASDLDATAALVTEALRIALVTLSAPERGGAHYAGDLETGEQVIVQRNVGEQELGNDGLPVASFVHVRNTTRPGEIERVFNGTILRLVMRTRSSGGHGFPH